MRSSRRRRARRQNRGTPLLTAPRAPGDEVRKVYQASCSGPDAGVRGLHLLSTLRSHGDDLATSGRKHGLSRVLQVVRVGHYAAPRGDRGLHRGDGKLLRTRHRDRVRAREGRRAGCRSEGRPPPYRLPRGHDDVRRDLRRHLDRSAELRILQYPLLRRGCLHPGCLHATGLRQRPVDVRRSVLPGQRELSGRRLRAGLLQRAADVRGDVLPAWHSLPERRLHGGLLHRPADVR
jgi:hypothetical protein